MVSVFEFRKISYLGKFSTLVDPASNHDDDNNTNKNKLSLH